MAEISFEKRLQMCGRPDLPLIMHQNWSHLLFLHWKVDKEFIQNKLPEGLWVDTFQGEAYVSVLPFYLTQLKVPPLPHVPLLTDFLEVNVRTYVIDKEGNPGVWFFSLDINSWVGMAVGNIIFSLPYHKACIQSKVVDSTVYFSGHRSDVYFEFEYTPENDSYNSKADSLDFFLTERYLLYTLHHGKLYAGRVHHSAYYLSSIKSLKLNANLLGSNGIHFSNKPDYLMYTAGLHVEFFKFQKV